MLNWIYGTSSVSVSGNVGDGTVGAEEMGILIIWVRDPLPTATANVFDDGQVYMCTVLIDSTQDIGYDWDKGVPGIGGIFWYRWMSEWTDDDEVAGSGRRGDCACERGNGKCGFEAIYIDGGEKIGKRAG